MPRYGQASGPSVAFQARGFGASRTGWPVSVLILMDVDGVLNPALTRDPDTSEPVLSLTPGRAQLLSGVSGLGELVWATSHGWAQTAWLEAQAGITAPRPRIPLRP
jgi:hypothetical protein